MTFKGSQEDTGRTNVEEGEGEGGRRTVQDDNKRERMVKDEDEGRKRRKKRERIVKDRGRRRGEVQEENRRERMVKDRGRRRGGRYRKRTGGKGW